MAMYWYQTIEAFRPIEELTREYKDKNAIVHIVTYSRPIGLEIQEVIENHADTNSFYFILPDAHFAFGKENAVKDISQIANMKRLAQFLSEKNATLICVSPYGVEEISLELRDLVYPMDIGLPTLSQIKRMGIKHPERYLGFTELQIRNIVAKGLDPMEEKVKLFAKLSFEYKKPERSFNDIGGMKNIKEWIVKRKPFIHKKDKIVPIKGIVLAGAPGTGKSVIAEAIAKELDCPYLDFAPSKIMSKYYGETEARTYEALKRIDALGSAVLRIDEIDKLFAGEDSSSATDGGTTARMQGIFQSWMAAQKNIFIVGTTNKPHIINPAILRRGRIDQVFHVPLPSVQDLIEIHKIYANKIGYKYDDTYLETIAKESENLTGAEVEQAYYEYYIEHHDEDTLKLDNMRAIIQKYKSTSRSTIYDKIAKKTIDNVNIF